MITCTLEECRNIKSEIVESKCETILKTWETVSEDLAVTRLVCGISTYSKDTVTVEIDELKVTGKESSCHTAVDVAAVEYF